MTDAKTMAAINAIPKTLYTPEGLKIIGVREFVTILRYIEPNSFRLDPNEDIEFTPADDTPDSPPDFNSQTPMTVMVNQVPQRVFVDEDGKDRIESDFYNSVRGDAKFLISDDWSHSFETGSHRAIRFVYDLAEAKILLLQVSSSRIELGEKGGDYEGSFSEASRSQRAEFDNNILFEMEIDLPEFIRKNDLQVANVIPYWAQAALAPADTKAAKSAPAM